MLLRQRLVDTVQRPEGQSSNVFPLSYTASSGRLETCSSDEEFRTLFLFSLVIVCVDSTSSPGGRITLMHVCQTRGPGAKRGPPSELNFEE